MLADPHDTIVALSSAPGACRRGIVRLSGARAFDIAAQLGFGTLLAPPTPPSQGGEKKRRLLTAPLSLPGLSSPLPCDGYFFPGPHSYTGQDVVELHIIGSPPLLDLLVLTCLDAGARAAQPGEFTLRAFRAGKLDLTQAEAVLAVIDAGNPDELRQALVQRAGGMATPLHELRYDLLNLLADVEAGLDFAAEDITVVGQEQLLLRLAAALAKVILVQRQIEKRALADRPFRVVLAGRPNAGKSSLFNALLGKKAALVSPRPGTTRDYVEGELRHGGAVLRLVDTAGLCDGVDAIETAAQGLGRDQQVQADLVLWCCDASGDASAGPAQSLTVWTKVDLASALGLGVATSAASGAGIEELKDELARRVRQRPVPALASSLTRCRHHVAASLACLRRAHAIALEEDPPELLALEIRTALEELGAMVGAVFTDDLLDRVFSRFCIGK